MIVEVWTSDDQRFLYEVTEVRRTSATSTTRRTPRSEELWLQTSEGPAGTPGKPQVGAQPLSDEARPTTTPIRPRTRPLRLTAAGGAPRLDPVDPAQDQGRSRRQARP